MKKIFFNGNLDIGVKDFIVVIIFLGGILAAWYELPSRIMASFEERFMSKEVGILFGKQLDKMDAKIDKLLERLK